MIKRFFAAFALAAILGPPALAQGPAQKSEQKPIELTALDYI